MKIPRVYAINPNMKILVINSAEPGIVDYIEPITGILEPLDIEHKTIEYGETLGTNTGDYAGIIISGSPRGDDIVDHHQPYFQWIKNYTGALLGICAGHHILGYMYGSQLRSSLEKEVGDFPIFLDCKDPLFQGMPSTFIVSQNHHDSISLPEDFLLLAHSDRCEVEAIRHREKPLYSTQFHPEILNPGIINNFVHIATGRHS